MPDVTMKKHGCDKLPWILLPGNGKEVASDPEISIVMNIVEKDKDDPIHDEEADRNLGDLF